MDFHTKIVSESELKFFLRAHQHNLTPPIISYHQLAPDHKQYPKFSLVTARFPEVLIDVLNDKDRIPESLYILECSRKLVSSLHSIDILHGDISEENIVYDKATRSVALIDFGLSKFISSIQDADVPSCVEELYEGVRYAGTPTNTIEYLLNVELGIITFLTPK
jgi:tRNA A-37 threonylcarbamoyl transferase component Bud32